MLMKGGYNMATPQYTKNAINRYNAKFDRVAVNLPKGSKEKIKELTGKSCNAYISELVVSELDKLENDTEKDTKYTDSMLDAYNARAELPDFMK